MRLDGFDARAIEPAKSSSGAIPSGEYVAEITESETLPNKAGTGSYLKLTFRISEGEFERRLLWTRLNLEHPNPLAVEIAKGELSSICRAVGVLTPSDSSDLHGIPLAIRVVQVPRRDTGEMVNEIKGFKPVPEAPPTKFAGKPVAGHRPFGGPMGAVSKPGVATKTNWTRKPNPPTDLTPPADMPF